MARGTYWGPALSESQYAVFENRAAAESYCRQKVEAMPALGCRIYNYQGQVVESFSDSIVYDRHRGRPAAKRNLWIGLACLVAGIDGVALDAWLGWRLVFGMLLGVRFLRAGTAKTIDEIAGLREARSQS